MKKPNINFNRFSIKQAISKFKTRSFRVGGYSVFATCIVVAIVIVINILAESFPTSLTQFDTTSSQLFSISEQTTELVEGLEKDITVYWVVQSGEEDSTIETLLDRYEALSEKIHVVKKDPDVYPTFVEQYTSTVYNNSLIVECGEKNRYVDYNDIYVYDTTNYYTTGTYDVSFAGESELTSAIDYVISENLPKIYTLTGHGEGTIPDSFLTSVEKENIEIESLSLLTIDAIPEDADCLLVYAPSGDISESEKDLLLSYLASGGNMIYISSPLEDNEPLPNFEAVMEYYGMSSVEGIVVEGNQNNYIWNAPYYVLPDMGSHSITSPLLENNYYVLTPLAGGINVSYDTRDTLTVTELLTTSADAYSKVAGYNITTYEKEDGDIDGPFAIAAIATESIDDETETNVIWISSAYIVDEQSNTQVSGGNQDFFLNCINWSCEEEESSLTIHVKSMSYEYLTIDSATASALTVLIMAIIPLGYLIIGIRIRIRRRKR